jgi:putative aldouronate transport system permease protein
MAILINEIRRRWFKKITQTIMLLPYFISAVLVGLLVYNIFNYEYGFLNGLLKTLDLEPWAPYQEPKAWPFLIVLVQLWQVTGYNTIIYFATIMGIDSETIEAAQIDGAGKWAQMRYVVLPSILSTIVIMLITRIGSLLNIGYEKVLLLYNSNTFVTADVVSTFAQRYGLEGASKGIASAAEMMNNVIGMLLVIGANTIARKASDTSLY